MIVSGFHNMNKCFSKRVFALILCTIIPILSFAKTINPRGYGIQRAKTGIERYEILMKCHKDAVKKGYSISYRGINQIELEIPRGAESIPLPDETDFCGVKLYVKNNSQNMFLFTLGKEKSSINIEKSLLTAGQVIRPLIGMGTVMLSIEDKTPWVSERKGFNHAVYRKDILTIENGVVCDNPIYSYTGEQSSPEAMAVSITPKRKSVQNISFYREPESTHKVYLLAIDNLYNVEVRDVYIYTPDDQDKYGDEAIRVCNSVNVYLKDIKIEGTYSQEKSYGYGVSINNVRNLEVSNLTARAKWGVFYTSNICNVHLYDCDLNRFDLHCYGRDITYHNCKFTGRPLPYSSLYGTLEYDHCTITDGDALNLRQDYNANTPFDVIWKDCVFNMSPSANCIIRVGGLSEDKNSRQELSKKCLPNITIQNCTVNLDPDLTRWFLIISGRIDYKEPVDYLSSLKVDGLTVNGKKEVPFDISSGSFNTSALLTVEINNSKVNYNGKENAFKLKSATVGKNARILVDDNDVKKNGPLSGVLIISKIINKLQSYF